MATLEHLIAAGVLIAHEADLEQHEFPERCVSYTPDLDVWLDGDLKAVPKKRGRNETPSEQVEQLFYEFIVGEPMAYDVDIKKLDPLGWHVWEFKTPDVRIIGWIVRKRHFIGVCGELKDNIPHAKNYKPYIAKVVDYRNGLDLDAPKQIEGVALRDVL